MHIGKLGRDQLGEVFAHDMDAIGALRQGDDLGFKTSPFLCPDDLRRFVFPVYKKMVATAHAAGT